MNEQMRQRARVLRKQLTDAERRLWRLLHVHRLLGLKFKRQVLMGAYGLNKIKPLLRPLSRKWAEGRKAKVIRRGHRRRSEGALRLSDARA